MDTSDVSSVCGQGYRAEIASESLDKPVAVFAANVLMTFVCTIFLVQESGKEKKKPPKLKTLLAKDNLTKSKQETSASFLGILC